MRTRVYIAGPITLGNRSQNVQRAIDAMVALIKAGYAPLCPQLTHYVDPGGIFHHDVWMESDLPWIKVAHAVLRLLGPSKGADREVAFAMECGLPVFHDLQTLIDLLPRDQL